MSLLYYVNDVFSMLHRISASVGTDLILTSIGFAVALRRRARLGPESKSSVIQMMIEWGSTTIGMFGFYVPAVMTMYELSNKLCETAVTLQWGTKHSGLHETYLSPWLGDRKMDLKDAQYHTFRDALQELVPGMLVYFVVSQIFRYSISSCDQLQQVYWRSVFNAVVGLGILIYIHEFGMVFSGFFMLLNFVLLHIVAKWRYAVCTMWVFNITVLFSNDLFSGYKFRNIFGQNEWTTYMDDNQGSMRWLSSYPLLMLRLMSFNIDFIWSLRETETNETSKTKAVDLGERARVERCHEYENYKSIVVYLGYLMYFPLYLAGPILTFNAYISFLKAPQTTYDVKGKIRYILRFVCVFFVFEVFCHVFHVSMGMSLLFDQVVRIPNIETGKFDQQNLAVYLLENDPTPHETLYFFGYWSLMFLWFKFLILWRFFRIWALLDDIETVENMNRCMNNNYSISQFWRAWHRSFNRWLVRYIYAPLGGNRNPRLINKIFNILVVFTFVALWHDIKIELLAWGLLFSLFYVPELLAMAFYRSKYVYWFEGKPVLLYYLFMFAAGGNILMLEIANLVGYGLALNDLQLMLSMLITPASLLFIFRIWVYMSYAAKVMQDMRGETFEMPSHSKKKME